MNQTSNNIISTDEDPGLRIESFAVINLRDVSTNNSIICFIAMQTYKELKIPTVCRKKTLMEIVYYFHVMVLNTLGLVMWYQQKVSTQIARVPCTYVVRG